MVVQALQAQVAAVLAAVVAAAVAAAAAAGGEAPRAAMVMLAIGGGVNTLHTVRATLRKRRPCVVLADSGRAASVVAAAVLLGLETEEAAAEAAATRGELLMAEHGLSEDDVRMLAEHAAAVAETVRLGKAAASEEGERALLTLYHLSDDDADDVANQLDLCIMEALLSGCATAMDRVMLAVKWGEVERLASHQTGRPLACITSDRPSLGDAATASRHGWLRLHRKAWRLPCSLVRRSPSCLIPTRGRRPSSPRPRPRRRFRRVLTTTQPPPRRCR